MVSVDFDQYYCNLIVEAESKDCYEVRAILHYNGFPFAVDEENYLGQVRTEMGFTKNDEYPILTIDSSDPEMPNEDYVGKDAILLNLARKGLIQSHLKRSAYEGVGLKWLTDVFEPPIDDLQRDFKSTIQFYNAMKMFNETKLEYDTPNRNVMWMAWRFSKGIKIWYNDRPNNSGLSKLEKFAKI